MDTDVNVSVFEFNRHPSGHTSSLPNSSVGTSCSAPIHCRGIKKPALWFVTISMASRSGT